MHYISITVSVNIIICWQKPWIPHSNTRFSGCNDQFLCSVSIDIIERIKYTLFIHSYLFSDIRSKTFLISIPVFRLQICIKMVMHHIPIFVYHFLVTMTVKICILTVVICHTYASFLSIFTAICFLFYRIILLKLHIQYLILSIFVIIKIYIQIAEEIELPLQTLNSIGGNETVFHFILINGWFDVPHSPCCNTAILISCGCHCIIQI